MGLSPFEAPPTFSMMPYTELAHGVWHPKGGMYQIVEALMAIARDAGVEFVFDEAVARIDVDGARARGVVLAAGRRLQRPGNDRRQLGPTRLFCSSRHHRAPDSGP